MSLTDTTNILRIAHELYTFGDRYDPYTNWYIDRLLSNVYWRGYSVTLLTTMKLQTSFLDLIDEQN